MAGVGLSGELVETGVGVDSSGGVAAAGAGNATNATVSFHGDADSC